MCLPIPARSFHNMNRPDQPESRFSNRQRYNAGGISDEMEVGLAFLCSVSRRWNRRVNRDIWKRCAFELKPCAEGVAGAKSSGILKRHKLDHLPRWAAESSRATLTDIENGFRVFRICPRDRIDPIKS